MRLAIDHPGGHTAGTASPQIAPAFLENVHRMFPDALAARIERARWPRPPIFDWLQRAGNVTDAEMHRVFNCGIGMVAVVAAAEEDRAKALLTRAGETVFRIGAVVPRGAGAPGTVVI